MQTFVLRRLIQVVPTLLGITALTFVLLRIAPGDPLLAVLADTASPTPSDYAAVRQAYGLDDPAPVAYVRWLGRLLAGDLGYSMVNHRPVRDLIGAALPNSLLLASLALAVALGVGIPLGVLAACRRGTWVDQLVRVLAVAGHALPSFWLGLVFILVFSVQLRLVPAGGAVSLGANPWDLGDRLRHLVGPVAILSLAGIANYSRLVRTQLLEELGQDYLRTARAKGLSARRAVWGHALRPALVPVITALGSLLAQLVSGALVVEQVFAWPGMGRLAFDAARGKDAPVVLATVILASTVLLAGYLLRDLAYSVADPRVPTT